MGWRVADLKESGRGRVCGVRREVRRNAKRAKDGGDVEHCYINIILTILSIILNVE